MLAGIGPHPQPSARLLRPCPDLVELLLQVFPVSGGIRPREAQVHDHVVGDFYRRNRPVIRVRRLEDRAGNAVRLEPVRKPRRLRPDQLRHSACLVGSIGVPRLALRTLTFGMSVVGHHVVVLAVAAVAAPVNLHLVVESAQHTAFFRRLSEEVALRIRVHFVPHLGTLAKVLALEMRRIAGRIIVSCAILP